LELTDPVMAYTATTNLEAHMLVNMLQSEGIAAHVVEDQSGMSLWSFGTISQFHQPNVWVNQSDAERAGVLLLKFEESKRKRNNLKGRARGQIRVVCEECNEITTFPESLGGTTQDCSHCHAYVDVGDLPWEEDFGEPEE